MYSNAKPANEAARFEPRARYPAKGRIRGKPGAKLELRVTGFDGGDAKLVPVVELRRAA